MNLDEELGKAVIKNDFDEVKSLIDQGASVDYKYPNLPLLDHAVDSKNSSIVNLPLDEGASINVENYGGKTLLEYANESGKFKILRLLINGAIEQDKLDLVKSFLENTAEKVEVEDKNKRKTTWKLLHYAAYNGNLNIVQDIFVLPVEKRGDINSAESEYGWTPLHCVVYYNRKDVVSILIDQGADISAKDKDGKTPFEIASEQNHTEVANFLSEKQGEYNRSLLNAVKKRDISEITDLLNRGADVNVKNNRGDTPLHLVARNGHLEVVEKLIENGANVNEKDIHGETPLHRAAEKGRLEVVEKLIENGANVNEKDIHGETPLHRAAEKGRLEVVEKLIENGANVNEKGDNENTPLHWAAENGYLEVIEKLIENGANVNEKGDNENTPLHWAAAKGRLEVVEKLIEKGANIGVEDKGGKTPFERAEKNQRTEVAKFLATVKDNDDKTALHYAAEKGNLDLVRLLIENVADINAKNKDGMTPFKIALVYDKTEVINFLAIAKDKNNNTALHYAVEGDEYGLTFSLLFKGADLEARNEDGMTPLLLAAKRGSSSVVRSLVGSGDFYPDISVKDKNGRTALKIALEYNQTEMVDLLQEVQNNYNDHLFDSIRFRNFDKTIHFLNLGADVNATDEAGCTPLYRTVELYDSAIAKLLIDRGADVNVRGYHNSTLLHESINEDVAKLLIDRGANINARDDDGQTPLHRSLCSGRPRMVEFFVNSGADIEARDDDGQTPLHSAVDCCNSDNIELLIRKGANVNAEDNDNQTPLHYAAAGCDLNAAKSLINRGANINARDIFDMMPLHYTTKGNNLDVAEFLIGRNASINAKNKDGKTPLDLAFPSSELKKFLINAQNQKLVQRKRLHHHEDHDHRYSSRKPIAIDLSNQLEIVARQDILKSSLQNDKIDYNKGGATSGASKPSSWIGSIVNWIKGSTESPALLTSREHDNITITAVPEINATLVNNTLILSILATGQFNKTQRKQPIHENLLSPREQSMRLNNIDEDMIIRAMQQSEEFGDPDTKMDEVKISGNKTGMCKGGK
ncbi:ankyrin repeat domain-containing protein [Wolbachia endosymbiont (group A) of Agelastica alni]|uniref:ankyrin repeat domain-containing protein n=1 Tax=Wolbachia endosymbiont (group A) of Agelastica alni TaxID=3066130 RepID=UPI003132A722